MLSAAAHSAIRNSFHSTSHDSRVCTWNVAPVPSAAAGAGAGHARGPQQRGHGGPPGPLGPALPAVLPAVPAAGLGARPGVHISGEHLLLLQPLLGPGFRRSRLLLRHVLYPDFLGCTPAPPGTEASREGEFNCRWIHQPMCRCRLEEHSAPLRGVWLHVLLPNNERLKTGNFCSPDSYCLLLKWFLFFLIFYFLQKWKSDFRDWYDLSPEPVDWLEGVSSVMPACQLVFLLF